MKVATFGSIGIRLRAADTARVDVGISLGFTFLVSDAAGADDEIQAHLASRGYRNVAVYHNGSRAGMPRRNLGAWPTVLVRGSYTDKDARMCADADAGLAFWNGRSTGTARNIGQLRRSGKKVRVVSPGTRPAPTAPVDPLVAALLEDAGGMA